MNSFSLSRCNFAHSLISTHTPAWGVTLGGSVNENRTTHFNSHARVGRDYSGI